MKVSKEERPYVVWEPIPNSSQALAMDSRAHHTLFTGTRGPGKSDCQLMRFRRHVGKGYGRFWRGVLFDRQYKNLDDLVTKSLRWFPAFDDGARFHSSAKDYKWTWPTGEELLFRAISRKNDYMNFHGHEFPWIGWNELCKFPTDDLYNMMMSVNRTSFLPEKDSPRNRAGKILRMLDPIPLEVFSTTNPYGVGHGWVKRRFIDPAPYGKLVKTETKIFNPQTQCNEVFTKTQVAIFGSYRENIYLPPEYIVELERISDPVLRRAWLLGDWDIAAGGAIADVWERSIHIIPQFKIPDNWYVDRAFDWGSTTPFYIGWFAEANGEEVTMSNGFKFCPAPGSLILFDEWYGTKEVGSNVGLMLSAPAIAEGIINRERVMIENGILNKIPNPGPADNQIRNVHEKSTETIEKKMEDKGVRWTESDKSKGSRVNGLQLLRDRLAAALTGEGPAFYIMQNCVGAISTLPILPRDELNMDDVDSEAEDHPYDVIRFRVLLGSNRAVTSLKVMWPH